MRPHPEIAECFVVDPQDRPVIQDALQLAAADYPIHHVHYGLLIKYVDTTLPEAIIEVKDMDARFILGALIHAKEINGPESPAATTLLGLASTNDLGLRQY